MHVNSLIFHTSSAYLPSDWSDYYSFLQNPWHKWETFTPETSSWCVFRILMHSKTYHLWLEPDLSWLQPLHLPLAHPSGSRRMLPWKHGSNWEKWRTEMQTSVTRSLRLSTVSAHESERLCHKKYAVEYFCHFCIFCIMLFNSQQARTSHEQLKSPGCLGYQYVSVMWGLQ